MVAAATEEVTLCACPHQLFWFNFMDPHTAVLPLHD